MQAELENAVLASGAGGLIEVDAESNGERAKIRITDHGEGIAPDILPSVCLVGYNTRRCNAGMGLAIAKQVVKAQHGGDLQVQSAPGKGTTVIFYVPLEDEI